MSAATIYNQLLSKIPGLWPANLTPNEEDALTKAAFQGDLATFQQAEKALLPPHEWATHHSQVVLLTMAIVAAHYGHLNIVRYLCQDRGVQPHQLFSAEFHIVKRSGISLSRASLIRQAMAALREEVALYLIPRLWKGEVNFQDENGLTILHLACQTGLLKVVKKLVIEKKADIDLLTKDGWSPLSGAGIYGQAEIVCFLFHWHGKLKNKTKQLSFLTDMIRRERVVVLKALVRAGYVDCHKESLLHTACHLGRLSVATWLIQERGVNPNGRDSDGRYPLHLLCMAMGDIALVEKVAIIKMLLEAGADPNMRGSDGRRPLHLLFLAKENITFADKVTILKMFVEAGADLNVRDSNGRSPPYLSFMAEENITFPDKVAMIKMLVEAGVDPNMTDARGRTALHYICGRGEDTRENVQLVKVLLELGAEPAVSDSSGWTPARTARYLHCIRLSTILQREGRKQAINAAAFFLQVIVQGQQKRQVFGFLCHGGGPF